MSTTALVRPAASGRSAASRSAASRSAGAHSALRLVRESSTDVLVQLPVSGDSAVWAEYRLHQFTNVLSGWSFASKCWHLYGLRIISRASGAVLWTLTDQNSAWEWAYPIALADEPSSAFDYYGSLHQAIKSTSVSLALDGIDVSGLAVGSDRYGSQLSVAQTADIYLPADTTTVIGSVAWQHAFTRGGVLVEHQHSYSAGYQIYGAYAAMQPTTSAGIDTYQVGPNAPAARVYDGSANNLGTQAASVVGSHASAHPYQVWMSLPADGPDVRGDWSKSDGYKLWFEDRVDPTIGKFYANWVSGTYGDRVAAVASRHRTHYRVAR